MRDGCTCTGAVTRSGTQDVLVIAVSSHERAAGGDGSHAVACGLVETLAVTPYGLWHVIMGGGDQDARPWSPFAEEALEGCSTTEVGGVSDCFPRQFKKDALVYDVTLQSLKLPLYSATIQKRSNQGCLGGAAG